MENQEINPLSPTKVLDHLDRLAEWDITGTCRPVMLDLHLTNICNHNCPQCNGDNELYRTAAFTYDEAIKAISEFYELGIKSIVFSGGGDPVCHPAAIDIVKYCHTLGIDIGFLTNGGLLHKIDYSVLLNICTWIRVSLDAGSEKVYTLRHGSKADWHTTIENIKNMAQFTNRNAVVGVSYLIDQDTEVDDVWRAAKLVKDLGIDYIELKSFRFSTNNIGDELNKIQSELQNNTFGVHIQSTIYKAEESERTYDICHGQHFIAVVTATGNMYRCCELMIRKEPTFGNVKQTPVKDIWYSYERLNAAANSKKNCPAFCRNHRNNETMQQLFYVKHRHGNFV